MTTDEDSLNQDYELLDEQEDEWSDSSPAFTEAEGRSAQRFGEAHATDIAAIRQEIADLSEFRNLAESIVHNAKGEVLTTALEVGFGKAEALGAQRKAIIFTESRRTQSYLYKLLSDGGYAGKLVMFNGSNNDPQSRALYRRWLDRHQGTDRISGSRTSDQRAAIVDYFRNEAEIMIATEAAAEGINLQFCSLVVNYDLPWNPQRIEQRIGRCHRYGQQHDVVVVNFLNKHNAADQRVFELLSEKFALFSGVFGASDEVLGSIESGVDFEKRILGIYQTCRTPAEIQLSFDQLQAELGGQIDEKMQITRQRLLENFDEEVHEKLRVNLHESTEYLNRYERMLWNLTCHALQPYADFAPDDHVFTLQTCPEGASVPVGNTGWARTLMTRTTTDSTTPWRNIS